jgi:hypothetical protein
MLFTPPADDPKPRAPAQQSADDAPDHGCTNASPANVASEPRTIPIITRTIPVTTALASIEEMDCRVDPVLLHHRIRELRVVGEQLIPVRLEDPREVLPVVGLHGHSV